ncbi:DinB family protein [Allonocardiopsis opalescens]|uniref:DinB family protein n=1 Tax=Allonocardiopsis opalescens TaxID=1144618 RepID=A0A2T0PZG8_9ACTN|nr:DinB family protein [Allonocardiopsis opalescens]PRX96807.1 DinB family protein [Allonocardiopsis opalescens]
MPLSRTELLRWQFDFTWSLFELHLAELAPEDFRWEPAPLTWTMHRSPDGTWTPDWAETEPDPIPVPTTAWTTWHIGWWWTVTLDHMQGRPPTDRTAISWPGPGEPTIAWLRSLHDQWRTVLSTLTEADLDAPAPFPWQNDPTMTVAHTAAWLNAELMKNVTEIGQLRLIRAASTS